MAERIDVFYDEHMLEHENGAWHPERPDRLRAILRELKSVPADRLQWHRPRMATVTELRRIHSIGHVDKIDSVRGKTCRLDPDTGVTPGSTDAAYLAAGASMQLVERLMSGASKRGFALVRPPGHHAERDKVRGFCLFNNIALAAEHAVQEFGCRRVMVIDFDVHHCNGTQQAFYDRDDVLVFSSHRYPFFPGSGRLDEMGEGVGRGYTINLPLAVGFGDEIVCALYHALLPGIAATFEPDLVLVSAGYDAHLFDPLGGLRMSDAGFASLAGLAREIAETYADGRLGMILEGGYDLDALARGVHGAMDIMAGAEPPRIDPVEEERELTVLEQSRMAHEANWPVLAR